MVQTYGLAHVKYSFYPSLSSYYLLLTTYYLLPITYKIVLENLRIFSKYPKTSLSPFKSLCINGFAK
jgi:hypothetical protein